MRMEKLKKTFRAAMASADITPTKSAYLQGYLARGDPRCLSECPKDFTSDILARVLIVDNGEDALVFINTEVSVSYPDAFTEDFVPRVAEICNTKTDRVLFSNNHNHQSIVQIEYANEQKILKAVAEAQARLEPASVGVGVAPSPYAVSRGMDFTADMAMPVDNLLTVARFDGAKTKKPIGMVWNLPFHGTMLSNGSNPGPDGMSQNYNLLSCEFSGYASRFLEEGMRGENEYFCAMFIAGFMGNAGPLFDGKWNAGSPQELKKAGEAVGSQVLSLYGGIKPEIFGGDIAAAVGSATLPANPDPAIAGRFSTDLAVMAGSFGDALFLGANFEVFSIIGARLRAELPCRYLMPAGGACGTNGYLPTKEAFDLPPYHENATYTSLGPDSEEAFYEKTVDTVCEMAGVSLERIKGTAAPAVMEKGTAVYAFDYGGAISPDKIVISFGQKSRNGCASDFVLKLYDESGNESFSRDFEGYSVNYIGVPSEGANFACAKLEVKKRWRDGKFVAEGIDALPFADVYGVKFVPAGQGGQKT